MLFDDSFVTILGTETVTREPDQALFCRSCMALEKYNCQIFDKALVHQTACPVGLRFCARTSTDLASPFAKFSGPILVLL